MNTHTETFSLSNGAALSVRIERGPAGDVMLHEQNTMNPHGGGRIYWRISRLYLMNGDEAMPMRNPRFECAETVGEAAELALGFFVECAESCIQHARAEGIPVEHCYI
ncbi:hypothetical protein [Streptomyces sp. NPDC053048]|uniref:hypothetical protein n=1 Tax=Streptomyces sp. NPDC053048 TaxID=3365694 RepID=UPI0037D699FF